MNFSKFHGIIKKENEFFEIAFPVSTSKTDTCLYAVPRIIQCLYTFLKYSGSGDFHTAEKNFTFKLSRYLPCSQSFHGEINEGYQRKKNVIFSVGCVIPHDRPRFP